MDAGITDDIYMQRALQLARNGEGFVSPNPMVGAVIVTPGGKIIGEGWHRKYGEAHAEVNAISSVSDDDKVLIKDSTIYVTLEPCSHYGKTPPCADLLIDSGVRRAVIATSDPFSKVNGEGIRRMKDSGMEVIVGVREKEARELNKTFFFAHTHRRPYITLKWAQSADGWMDSKSSGPFRFSTEITTMDVHRIRSLNDAIITSTSTIISDNPRLDTRFWPSGRNPRPVVIGKSPINEDFTVKAVPDALFFPTDDIASVLTTLYRDHNITSALVEAGPGLLQSFIAAGLWNEARVEVNPLRLDKEGCKKAPDIPCQPVETLKMDGNMIYLYKNE